MPTPSEFPQDPITRFDDFLRVFHESVKPKDAFRIGPEMEKFGVYTEDASPLRYSGERGILALFAYLEKEHGWTPQSEGPGGPTLSLLREGGSITLEPGGQFELSGAAVTSVHEVCVEFSEHMRELAPISEKLGIAWMGLGFQPFAKREDFEWVPKIRYPFMRKYLPTRGAFAHDMMLRTSTVQANFDYLSESDAMRKLRIGLRLAPLTTALFANSPFVEGAPFGGVSMRARVWLDVDNDRAGLLPTLWKEDAKFSDYVAWALDVPMFLIKREGEVLANTGQTFRSFFENGFEGHRPTVADWLTHLNTLFPEVRLKKTIEVRGADAQGKATRCALPALWTGIYYDEKALNEAEALVSAWTYEEVNAARARVFESGLRTPFRGATFQKPAEALLDIAKGGLARRARLDPKGRDESKHLENLRALVALGKCPADALLEEVRGAKDFKAAVMRATVLATA